MSYRFVAPKAAYTLAWPWRVLRAELAWLLRSAPPVDVEAAELLLQEAFISDEPRDEFAAISSGGGFGAPAAPTKTDMLDQLLAVVDQLPTRVRPRPYWHQRQGLQTQPGEIAPEQQPGHRLQVAWVGAVGRFLDQGYLNRAAPTPCVDGDERPQDDVLEEQLQRLLGISDLWPLQPGAWNEDTFHSLIEAVGDLIARPRSRWWHDYASCGWHYSKFATTPGQALYRAEVNDLLERAGSGLQLASDGEDAGRLVRVAGDDREELVHRVLATAEGADRDALKHATALFRARAAGREDKRSAVVALARLLEDRRATLKTELLRKDEGALFQIANEYDVRHREARQHGDYDEAFLEWVFWWYLATVELTDRLLARQGGTP